METNEHRGWYRTRAKHPTPLTLSQKGLSVICTRRKTSRGKISTQYLFKITMLVYYVPCLGV